MKRKWVIGYQRFTMCVRDRETGRERERERDLQWLNLSDTKKETGGIRERERESDCNRKALFLFWCVVFSYAVFNSCAQTRRRIKREAEIFLFSQHKSQTPFLLSLSLTWTGNWTFFCLFLLFRNILIPKFDWQENYFCYSKKK